MNIQLLDIGIMGLFLIAVPASGFYFSRRDRENIQPEKTILPEPTGEYPVTL